MQSFQFSALYLEVRGYNLFIITIKINFLPDN